MAKVLPSFQSLMEQPCLPTRQSCLRLPLYLTPCLNPSAGACRNSPSALIVEVCYYIPAPAPDYDDVHIPYAVEAGQGT